MDRQAVRCQASGHDQPRPNQASQEQVLSKSSQRVRRTTPAHVYEMGGARRSWLRGLVNVSKRYLMTVAVHNRGLLKTLRSGQAEGSSGCVHPCRSSLACHEAVQAIDERPWTSSLRKGHDDDHSSPVRCPAEGPVRQRPAKSPNLPCVLQSCEIQISAAFLKRGGIRQRALPHIHQDPRRGQPDGILTGVRQDPLRCDDVIVK